MSDKPTARLHLLFVKNDTRQALAHYEAVFGPIYELESIVPAEGPVQLARFRIDGLPLQAADSPGVQHDFDFTPAMSVFIEVEDPDQVDRLAEALADGGQIFMPPGDYGFSPRFAWVGDRHGVTWQLNTRT